MIRREMSRRGMSTKKFLLHSLLIKKKTSTSKYTNLMYSTKPEMEAKFCDAIGKPDQLSNLRPYQFHIPSSESNIERQYREERQQVQDWNQKFWEKHNLKFIKEREEYVADMKETLAQQKRCKKEDIVVTADEMSVFYKTFLDKHWHIHLKYNIEWYKKNARLIVLAVRTNLYKVFRKWL